MSETNESSDIIAFYHCSECLKELPVDESPASYARYAVGQTASGEVQVWCNRHEMEIVTIGIAFQMSGRGKVHHE